MESKSSDNRDMMALVSVTGGIALANSGIGIGHGSAGPLGTANVAICAVLLAHALQSHQRQVQDLNIISHIQEIEQWIADALGGDSCDEFNTLNI